MPQPGDVVDELGTPRGKVTVRYPREGDAPRLLDFINAISRERTFVHFQGEQLTLEQEETWLADRLAGIAAGREIYLMAEHQDKAIGGAGIARKIMTESHVGVFGISIAADWRGLGLGTAMLRCAVAEAAANIEGLRIVELTVFSGNMKAHALYEREGFVEHGRLPGGIHYDGEDIDAILMYRRVSLA